MNTTATLPPFDRSLLGTSIPKRHARMLADRQPIPAAGWVAAVDGAIVLASLAGVLIVTNRHAMPQGLDNFLSMRVTLRNVAVLAILVAGWRVIFHLCGLYTMAGVRVAATERQRVCAACALGSLVVMSVMRLATTAAIGPAGFLSFFCAATAATLGWRSARRAFCRRRAPRRVLIVGTGTRALALWERLCADEAVDYQLAGFLDTADSTPASDDIARQRVGTLDQLETLLMQHAIDEVSLALPIKSHYRDIQEAILVCERVGVRTTYQATLFETEVAWPRYDDPNSPTVTMHVVPNDYRLRIKRVLDVLGSVLALVALSPILLAAAIAIQATSPGPVIFSQERYGLNRRRFRMLKFRTMRVDAEQLQAALEARNEADGPVFKMADDPRVTKVGRFLRRTSIDELPQLINVLHGEMSLVGPRPLPLRDVTRFTSASDMRRFSVRPGLTCLWQISGRSTLTFNDWIRLDLTYIDGWSLGLDLLILLRTVPAVLTGTGAR